MNSFITILLFNILSISVFAQDVRPHKNERKESGKEVFIPKKLVVIGMTDDMEARKSFERLMKDRLRDYDINAYQSNKISSVFFTTIDAAEKELNQLVQIISQKGYDGFIMTAVTGLEERRENIDGRFEIYKVYHMETDIYTIENKDILLFWGTCLDVYDYQLVQLEIEDYVNAIIIQMEHEDILPKVYDIKKLPITNQ